MTNPASGSIINKWDESQHPRDESGKFTDGGRTARSARAELDERLSSSAVSTKLDSKKQDKHIEGTKAYKNAIAKGIHPSRLTIDQNEIPTLIDRYTKEGEARILDNGSIRVTFTYDKPIGVSCNPSGAKESVTSVGEIHYSKTGAHIVPIEQKGS